MPSRLLMLLILALGALLLGHVGGGRASEAVGSEAARAVHVVRVAKVRHHVTARTLSHAHNHGEHHGAALYDDDEDDDDGDDGVAVPPTQNDDNDAAPSAIAEAAVHSKLPPSDLVAASQRRDLGPASGHPRPDEDPPRG